MKALLLTLGHNSSAILVEDHIVVAGYEEERLSGIKSDSRFPRNAIERVLRGTQPDVVYCTHWEPFADLSKLAEKYWDSKIFEQIPIRSLTDCTHHDTHAHAAVAFAGPHFPTEDTYILVVDGFGSFGEHLSVYRMMKDRQLVLTERLRGYNHSLGLLYQYTTAFVGLKMHEDEYKLLGYEVHVTPKEERVLRPLILQHVREWGEDSRIPLLGSMYDPVFNLRALDATREVIFSKLSRVLSALGYVDPTAHESRVALAYYVQNVLEECVLSVISRYKVRNLIVSGGVFYNVKLNNTLLHFTPEVFCAYPLAGDQGNALGLYAMDFPTMFTFPSNLFWGHRELKNVGEAPGLEYVKFHDWDNRAAELLDQEGFVNVVRGGMEFGPRALCNTSTLALPTLHNVDIINSANGRNTVMPMAPVMTREQWVNRFEDTSKVWRSENYMILAMDFKPGGDMFMPGAAHYYKAPYTPHATGRPQVTEDPAMTSLLWHFGPLINTSFNVHGKPIAFDMPSIIENHLQQYRQNPHFKTLVVVE